MSIYSDSSKNTSREQPQSSRLTGTGAGGEARGAQPPAATSAASPPAWWHMVALGWCHPPHL